MILNADGRLLLNQSKSVRHALACAGCRLTLLAQVIAAHHPRAVAA